MQECRGNCRGGICVSGEGGYRGIVIGEVASLRGRSRVLEPGREVLELASPPPCRLAPPSSLSLIRLLLLPAPATHTLEQRWDVSGDGHHVGSRSFDVPCEPWSLGPVTGGGEEEERAPFPSLSPKWPPSHPSRPTLIKTPPLLHIRDPSNHGARRSAARPGCGAPAVRRFVPLSLLAAPPLPTSLTHSPARDPSSPPIPTTTTAPSWTRRARCWRASTR